MSEKVALTLFFQYIRACDEYGVPTGGRDFVDRLRDVWLEVAGEVDRLNEPLNQALAAISDELQVLRLANVDSHNRLKSIEQRVESPVPMRLLCPECRTLHIDEGEFATKLHHTHACQSCGNVWRPAIVPTVGVQFLPGFKND